MHVGGSNDLPERKYNISNTSEMERSKDVQGELGCSMGKHLLQFQPCNPAQGRRSSGGKDPRAKVTKEGLVLLTSKVERRELREMQKCLLSRIRSGGHRALFRVMSAGSGGSWAPLDGRSGLGLSLRSRGSRARSPY